MAFTESSTDGVINGTVETVLIAAPASSTRRLIRTITIRNNDASDIVVSIKLKNSSNTRIIWRGTLEPGDTWQFGEAGDILVLDATTKSVVAVLDTNPTTNPDFTASFGDAS